MSLSRFASLSALFLTFAIGRSAMADTLVSLNAPATVVSPDPYGNYNNSTSSNLQKITNGTILPDSTNYGSSAAINQALEWNGSGYVFQITLPTLEDLTGIILDADDNDAYTITYLNMTTGDWDTLYDAPIVSVGFGIRTRPDTGDQTAEYALANIDTDAVRISGGASDDNFCSNSGCGQGGYAVAQVELFGSPVPTTPVVGATPEPSSLALLATGMAGAAGLVRRRARR